MKWLAVTLVVLEVVSVLAVAHLWSRRQIGLLAKALWTVFLLIPVLGPLFYGFVTLSPEAHGEHPRPFGIR